MSDETEHLTPAELRRVERETDLSYQRDPERWRDSYLNHSATALTRRVLADMNSHTDVNLNPRLR